MRNSASNHQQTRKNGGIEAAHKTSNKSLIVWERRNHRRGTAATFTAAQMTEQRYIRHSRLIRGGVISAYGLFFRDMHANARAAASEAAKFGVIDDGSDTGSVIAHRGEMRRIRKRKRRGQIGVCIKDEPANDRAFIGRSIANDFAGVFESILLLGLKGRRISGRGESDG